MKHKVLNEGEQDLNWDAQECNQPCDFLEIPLHFVEATRRAQRSQFQQPFTIRNGPTPRVTPTGQPIRLGWNRAALNETREVCGPPPVACRAAQLPVGLGRTRDTHTPHGITDSVVTGAAEAEQRTWCRDSTRLEAHDGRRCSNRAFMIRTSCACGGTR